LLPGCGLSTVIKVIFNLIFTENKSVPIQLAQCRFRWLAILMLKYEYISQIKYTEVILSMGGLVAEWLSCWTQAQKGRVQIAAAVLGKLFTPIVHLFTKQRNW